MPSSKKSSSPSAKRASAKKAPAPLAQVPSQNPFEFGLAQLMLDLDNFEMSVKGNVISTSYRAGVFMRVSMIRSELKQISDVYAADLKERTGKGSGEVG